MDRSRVDYDTIARSFDERYAEHEYPGLEAALSDVAASSDLVLDVGCGTGRWLEALQARGCRPVGLDPSAEMLAVARRHPELQLVRGFAESLPFASRSVNAVVVVNALHHFYDPPMFIREAFRVLQPGGAFLSTGLDPGRGEDQWYVYDYFSGTCSRDRNRYPSTELVSSWLMRAGFESIAVSLAEHMRRDADARSYLERGAAAKHSTSGLVLLTDEDYQAGIDRIWDDVREGERRGEALVLKGDLHIYATSARVPHD